MKVTVQKRTASALMVMGAGALTLAVCPLVFGDHEAPMDGAAGTHIVVLPGDIKWMDAPPSLPPGAKTAVLEGDPSKPAAFTMRAKFPAGYHIPAHWHPAPERVTVLSGALNIGMGDRLDVTKGTKVPAGGFTLMPAKMHHFAWFDEETIIQVNGVGPWAINYLNAADDPNKVNVTAAEVK